MTDMIKAHGLKFAVESHGFAASHAWDDAHRAAEILEGALRALPAAEVAAIHAGSIMDPETGECAALSALDQLDRMAAEACAEATEDWWRNDQAAITASPVP